MLKFENFQNLAFRISREKSDSNHEYESKIVGFESYLFLQETKFTDKE